MPASALASRRIPVTQSKANSFAGLALDVAMHIGSLLAAPLYFRRDALAMAVGTVDAIRGQWNPGARLALQVIAATIPVVPGVTAQRMDRD